VLALLDATMSDLRVMESDPNALTVFAEDMNDEMTEVNLDLNGALEAVVEEETRVGPPARRGPSLEYQKIELRPHTINQRRGPVSWVEDLLVEEEFAFSEDDELPMLDSGEFLAVPRTDDLRVPSGIRNPRSLIAPEPKPLHVARVPLTADLELPKVVAGTPFVPIYARTKVPAAMQPAPVWPWISAIAFWAVTMTGAWAFRMELLGLVGLL
jgi:hypothetical protein